MVFSLKDATLRRLLASNHFEHREGMLLFGLRGALPINEKDWEPGAEKLLAVATVDYLHPRCSLGIWDPGDKTLSLMPGSTVPAQKHITASVAKGGKGTNLLAEGFLRFKKGDHTGSKPENRHAAFRQDSPFPHRRTSDDDLYEQEDELSVGWPGDNLHCAYCETPGKAFDSSQGCQVVCGFPFRPGKANTSDVGAWPKFRDRAYGSGQELFNYLLVSGSDAQAAALAEKKSLPVTLRFGSRGTLVKTLQAELQAKGFLKDKPDGSFGEKTLLALVALQRELGVSPDGVCGIHTAQALGIADDWPRV